MTSNRPLILYDAPAGRWLLDEDYRLQDGGIVLRILAPFYFDLASVPRVLWPLLAPYELGERPPLVHDFLYRSGGNPTGMPGRYGNATRIIDGDVVAVTFTRAQTDAMFLRQMKAEGVSWWRRTLAYLAVRTFGRGAWKA